MASQNIARLGIVLGLDSGELVTKITEAQQKFGQFKAQIKRDSEDAAKEIARLEMATRNYGKTLTEVEKVEEQIRAGKYKHQPDIIINSLKAQAAAYDKVAQSAKAAEQAKIGKTGGMTAQQQAALGYQTTDIVTSLAGGQNPMMILLQQGGQLRDQFGGFKPLFAGIAQVLTPMNIALGVTAGAMGSVAYAMYQGYEESKKFSNSLILTSNFAGTTAAQFNLLSASISDKFNVSIGETKSAMQAVISSGQFTSTSLYSVASAIAKVSTLTGESASATAEKLIPSLDGTASSAKRLNDQYHFLTLEQYKHIEALEKQGEKQEAIKVTTDALTEKLSKQKEQIGNLESAWKSLKNGVSSFFDSMKTAVGAIDLQKQVVMAAEAIEKAANPGAGRTVDQGRINGLIARYMELAKLQQEKALADIAEADKETKTTAKNDAAITFQQKYGQQLIDLDAKIAEEKERTKYAIAAKGFDSISQLEKKKAMEDALAELEIKRKISKDPQIGGKIRSAAEAEATRKKAEDALQQANISRDELENYRKKATLEQDAIDKEKERLDFYKQHLLASNDELEIALSRLKTEQQIAEIMQNKKLLDSDKNAEAEKFRNIQKSREAIIDQAAQLKMLQNMNDSVFSNMTSALENFVRTGKLSFKDLARSIIQDLLSIAMRAQMMAMFKGMGFMGSASSLIASAMPGDALDNLITLTGGFGTMPVKAAGGTVTPGTSYLVGENGPELFTSGTSGSITPNNVMNSGMGGSTNVTNNYINAIDTKSFEDRLLGSSKAIWAANKYGEKNLSVGTGRT